MKALVSRGEDGRVLVTQLEDLNPQALGKNQVRINPYFSGINYKDALAVTGQSAIFKKLPLVGGIDVAGVVSETLSPKFKVGDQVLVTGCGLGETHDGGYAEQVIEDDINVIPCPAALSLEESMIYGTAGFTAALALKRMLTNGQRPGMGPILVTGASGGVGQFAVSFFAKAGFKVWAASGKKDSHPRLCQLGAERTLTPDEFPLAGRPLEKAILGGVVDNVGGDFLAGLIPQVQLWGNVCLIGLADGAQLNTTVMPMILRGVSLLGVSSNNTSLEWRHEIWRDLATSLKPKDLQSFVSQSVDLSGVLQASRELLARQIAGRVLVKIGPGAGTARSAY